MEKITTCKEEDQPSDNKSLLSDSLLRSCSIGWQNHSKGNLGITVVGYTALKFHL